MGGSASIISALIRGIEKHGGRVLTRAHVDKIHMEGDLVAGALMLSCLWVELRALRCSRAHQSSLDSLRLGTELVREGDVLPESGAVVGARPVMHMFLDLHIYLASDPM